MLVVTAAGRDRCSLTYRRHIACEPVPGTSPAPTHISYYCWMPASDARLSPCVVIGCCITPYTPGHRPLHPTGRTYHKLIHHQTGHTRQQQHQKDDRTPQHAGSPTNSAAALRLILQQSSTPLNICSPETLQPDGRLCHTHRSCAQVARPGWRTPPLHARESMGHTLAPSYEPVIFAQAGCFPAPHRAEHGAAIPRILLCWT